MHTPAKKTLDTLTEEDLEHLRFLNAKLAAVEDWIRQREARSLEWYYGAGGMRSHDHGDGLREDVETDFEVCCILREDHPDFDPDDDNIVARLSHMPSSNLEDDKNYNWNEFENWEGHPLRLEHHCYLFHDLCDHVLHWDLERIFSVGGVWIDVVLIQQREVHW